MIVVVFDTFEEADERQQLDLLDHLNNCESNDEYFEQTENWAIPRQRLDGKWDYPICPCSSYDGLLVEQYNKENYAQEEM